MCPARSPGQPGARGPLTTPKASWSVIPHPQDTGAEGFLQPSLQPPGVGGWGEARALGAALRLPHVTPPHTERGQGRCPQKVALCSFG